MVKFLFCIILCLGVNGFSQNMIQGKILDKETKQPMPFAFLIKKSTGKGAITNTDGFFSLSCSLDDTVTISYVGYSSAVVPVTYFLTNSDFYIEEKVSMLASVSVTGKVRCIQVPEGFEKGKKEINSIKAL